MPSIPQADIFLSGEDRSKGLSQREFALLKVYCFIEISNNKSQKTNK